MKCPICTTYEAICPVCSGATEAMQRDKANLEAALRSYNLLATEMIYQGNSVQHWHAKAEAYKGIVSAVCEAFRKLGYDGEFGHLHTLPDRLNEFVEKIRTRTSSERGQDGY